jgi:hypothetical protein
MTISIETYRVFHVVDNEPDIRSGLNVFRGANVSELGRFLEGYFCGPWPEFETGDYSGALDDCDFCQVDWYAVASMLATDCPVRGVYQAA